MAESGKGIDGGEDDGCSGGGRGAFSDHLELTRQIPKVLALPSPGQKKDSQSPPLNGRIYTDVP